MAEPDNQINPDALRVAANPSAKKNHLGPVTRPTLMNEEIAARLAQRQAAAAQKARLTSSIFEQEQLNIPSHESFDDGTGEADELGQFSDFADTSDNTRQSDEQQQESLGEKRMASLKQAPVPVDATDEAYKNWGGNIGEQGMDEVNNSETGSAQSQEVNLGASQSQDQQKQRGNLGQLYDKGKEAVKEYAKKMLKKQILAWAAAAAPHVLFWGGVTILISLIIFALGSVYLCWEEKGSLGLVWEQLWGDGFESILEQSFSGTCSNDMTVTPETEDTPTTPEPASTPKSDGSSSDQPDSP